MTTQMIIRIDQDLKNKASYLAKNEGKNISEIVRDLIKGYVKERDISTYVDELWGRIGNKMHKNNKNIEDIDTIIEDIRKNG